MSRGRAHHSNQPASTGYFLWRWTHAVWPQHRGEQETLRPGGFTQGCCLTRAGASESISSAAGRAVSYQLLSILTNRPAGRTLCTTTDRRDAAVREVPTRSHVECCNMSSLLLWTIYRKCTVSVSLATTAIVDQMLLQNKTAVTLDSGSAGTWRSRSELLDEELQMYNMSLSVLNTIRSPTSSLNPKYSLPSSCQSTFLTHVTWKVKFDSCNSELRLCNSADILSLLL